MLRGQLVALLLAALVWSFCEARTVSRCELKKELGELLVLPRELQRLKEKILTRVICRLERETQLNTQLLQMVEPSPAWSSAGRPTHRRKRDVEFFEEEMRKLQEEVDAMKPAHEEVQKHEEDEDRSVAVLKDRSSSDTNVIDQLDQEMGPEDDTSLTFEELKRILTSFKDKEVKDGGEDARRLEEDMRDTEDEVDRRVVDQLDREEVDAAEETDNSKDAAVIFEELEKLLVTDLDTGEANTEEEGQKLEEDVRDVEGEVEKRVIAKLDRDEVDTSEDENMEDSHLTVEDEGRSSINNMDGDETNTEDDTQEETEPRVIDEQDRDETEVDPSEDEEDTQAETRMVSTEDEERMLINSMDRDETNPVVDASEDHKAEDTSLTVEDEEKTSMVDMVDAPEGETSNTKGEDIFEEEARMTITSTDGDKMNVVQGDVRDTEKDMDWEDGDETDTRSMKGGRANLTFEELVSILVEKMKAAEDRPKLEEEEVVKDERDPEVDMSNVKTVLEEVERRVVSEDETNHLKESPEGEKKATRREEELMRHLNEDEVKPGQDAAGELEDGDQMKAGEDISKKEVTSSMKDEEEKKTVNQLDQDERNPVESRNMVMEDVVRRLIEEMEQDERSPVEGNTEDVNKRRILGKLRRIISKLDKEQREDAPRDKRDTSTEMGSSTDGSDMGSMADQDPLVDVDSELEKMFMTEQDDNDTLADKDLQGGSSLLNELLSDLDDVAEPSEEDRTSGGRRKQSLSRRRRPLRLFGLLQLSDQLTCDYGSGRSRNVCNTNCTAFIDDDITDDLACFVRTKAWTSLLRPACPADRDFFQDCP